MQRQALKLVCIWLFLSLTFCAYSHVVYNKQPNFSSSLYIIVISVHGFCFVFVKAAGILILSGNSLSREMMD